MNFDDLFESASKSITATYADRFVNKVESEFDTMQSRNSDRETEKTKCEEKLVELKKKLRACGNVKNHRRVLANTERSHQRQKIREEIKKIEARLEEITMEEEGEKLSAQGPAKGDNEETMMGLPVFSNVDVASLKTENASAH